MRGFINLCFGCLLGCFFSGAVVAHTLDDDAFHYHENESISAYNDMWDMFPTSLGVAMIGVHDDINSNLTGCSFTHLQWNSSIDVAAKGTCTNTGNGATNIASKLMKRFGSGCPPDRPYVGDPVWGCQGPQSAPPAEPDDPCVSSWQPKGGAPGILVDPTNCSIYKHAGGVSVCMRFATSTEHCNEKYCPTGDEKEGCTPGGWNPGNPGDPYTPDGNSFAGDGCTEDGTCDGSTPGTPAPPNAGEPDPSDPDGGSVGDQSGGSESTTTTGADGTTVTTEKTNSYNPYSDTRTHKETTTTNRPDGSSTTEQTTVTTSPSAGGGTTTTRGTTRTHTAPDGTVTTEIEGETTTDDTIDEEGDGKNASGGLNCSAEPHCTGDPIQCAVLKQVWRDNCVFNKISGGDSCAAPPVCDSSQIACANALQSWHDRCPQGAPDQSGIDAAVDALVPGGDMTVSELDAAAAGDPDYVPDSVVDLSSISIGPTNPNPSGSCPLPFSIVVLGIDVEIGSTELCDLTDWISWLVRISASIFALFIITGYSAGRSSGGA